MEVLKSLQVARCELQKREIKKSGRNKFSNYDYFELSDFLPELNEIMLNNNLVSNTEITENKAFLDIISIIDNSKLQFVCPVSMPEMKGANAIQVCGAVITYVRRYLLMMAFEIVESDGIDCNKLDNEVKQDQKINKKRLRCKKTIR